MAGLNFYSQNQMPVSFQGHPSVRWSNQCVYVCLICTDKPYKTYSASGFGNHLKSVHSMETFAYTRSVL